MEEVLEGGGREGPVQERVGDLDGRRDGGVSGPAYGGPGPWTVGDGCVGEETGVVDVVVGLCCEEGWRWDDDV